MNLIDKIKSFFGFGKSEVPVEADEIVVETISDGNDVEPTEEKSDDIEDEPATEKPKRKRTSRKKTEE
jgi:hypothetical protein